MSNLQQIKQIVHAKWTQSNGNNSASATQEELTAEAERLLKKSQSKSFINVSLEKTNFLNYFQRTKCLDRLQTM